MTKVLLSVAFSMAAQAPAPEPLPTEPFAAPKYGLTTQIPKDWTIAQHEQDDRIFVAVIPQRDFDRPGVAACELGLAPEGLDEYRTRIDSVYTKARPAFDALIAATRFSAPNTGADLLAKATNRWIQREYKFAIDLPEGWSPALAPSEVALFFANGPAHGVWSDNVLVLARAHGDLDLGELAKDLPDRLRQEEPGCEVLACKVVPQGTGQALEIVVRTRRGPFSMTVIERRFRGGRFDYEIKYTVESKRFEQLVPKFRQSFESFREHPGAVPAVGAGKAA
jgi:hypothetical protein